MKHLKRCVQDSPPGAQDVTVGSIMTVIGQASYRGCNLLDDQGVFHHGIKLPSVCHWTVYAERYRSSATGICFFGPGRGIMVVVDSQEIQI